MDPGKFITVEGGEGAGKSTQARLLGEALRERGVDTLVTREPGGARGAEAIRSLLLDPAGTWQPMSEALLHFAARREHLSETIEPALATGRWVVCDRFTDSTAAYQGAGRGLGQAAVEGLHRTVIGDFAPDLTLVLDIPVDDGATRLDTRRRRRDRYERMDASFHQRVRDAFLDIAQRDPTRCVVIDARGPIERVQEAVWRAVADRFGISQGQS